MSILHFITTTDGVLAHGWHIFFRKLYFIPIIAGAIWFELAGALFTAFAAIVVYTVHLIINWPNAPMERMDQIGEMASFIVLAAVSGVLVLLERKARDRANHIKNQAETEKIATAVAALTETLGARDIATREHSKRVAKLAKKFASFLGFSCQELNDVYLAGILHDIGKIGIRDDILLKPETLNDDEYKKIMEHPLIAEHILAPIGFTNVISYIASHHENVDGSGYPNGLSNDNIPVPAKILAIIDTYDALLSKRSYKENISEDRVRKIINDMSGKKLDKTLVKKFWHYMDSKDK